MISLEGKSVLVVGATGGLGSLIAQKLAAQGARVVSSGRDAVLLASLGLPGALVAEDLADPAAAERLVAAAIDANGALDGVVLASGVVGFGEPALADDALDALWTANTLGPIRVLREARPALRESAAAGRSPFAVTLSGVVSETPTAGLSAYSAVKAALAAFTAVTAREWRRDGIRVIDARPGHTETDLSRHPVAGTAPAFPTGLAPDAVAERIVRGIVDEERDLPSAAFA